MPEYPKGSGSIYPDNTTSSQITSGIFCGICGTKMYMDADHQFRCPSCHDGNVIMNRYAS